MKFILCLLAVAVTAASDDETNLEKLLVDANNGFNGKMFAQIVKEQPSRNIVTSGFSMLAPLAQLTFATVGDAREELLHTLRLPNDTLMVKSFPALRNRLGFDNKVTLKQANKIYLSTGLKLDNDFKAISEDVFRSEVQNINFTEQENAAKEINYWVENQTNGCIKDLMTPESFNEDTRIVIVNAIYFKGSWKKEFSKNKTKDCDFFISKNKTIKLPTMRQKSVFHIGEDNKLNSTLLRIPFDDDETSIIIILPRDIEGVHDLVKELKDPSILNSAVKQMRLAEIEIYLPKFKIETSINLRNTLSEIGLRSIFNAEQVNLEKLVNSKERIAVTNAVQKVFIEVNEEGAKAAASNILYITSRLSFDQPPFVADHPFVFCIMNREINLFTGVFVGA